MKICLHYKSLRGGAAAAPGLCNEGKKDHDVRARAPQTFRTRLRIFVHTLRTTRQQVRSVGSVLRIFKDRTQGVRVMRKKFGETSLACSTSLTDVRIDPQSHQSIGFGIAFQEKLILLNYKT